jgi:putative sigma-54 modulation protein
MTIDIRSQNFKVNGSLEDYATKKLERLYRYLPRIGDIRLELERMNTVRGEPTTRAQITVRHERGAILRAEEKRSGESTEAVEAAINAAVDKMYRQIERFKGKRNNHKGKTRFSATLEEIELAETIPQDETDTAELELADSFEELEIVRRKQVAVMPMTEEEAIQQMELLGHTFFVFFNEATNGINVLYKRAGGDYGVLVPELT